MSRRKKLKFTTDIFSLDKPSSVTFRLSGTKLPNNHDLFFRSKQKEIVEQYAAARIFLRETETDDWKHWFDPVENSVADKVFKLTLRSHFYEAALFYYNTIVDMSWTLCYVTAEFACNKENNRVDLSGIRPIDEAVALLRSAERNVTAPTAENNPFAYLKIMCPEFIPAFDQIINFWNGFSNSDIRKRYNFCKHKGRPAYQEIEALSSRRLMSFYVQNRNTGEKIQMASNISDVRFSFSLENAIEELVDFDDNKLFPYLRKLIDTLEDILKPSPMI